MASELLVVDISKVTITAAKIALRKEKTNVCDKKVDETTAHTKLHKACLIEKMDEKNV